MNKKAKRKDKKLLLNVDKVRDLRGAELEDVAGGCGCGCTHPSGSTSGGGSFSVTTN